jgi:hypothetical protein
VSEKHEIVGSPLEVGSELFNRLCRPVIETTRERPKRDVARLYAGIVVAAFGSMVEDFGYAQALAYLHEITDGMCDSSKHFERAGDLH